MKNTRKNGSNMMKIWKNLNKKNDFVIKITSNFDFLVSQIIKQLEAGKKVVIPTTSKQSGVDIKNRVQEYFENKGIMKNIKFYNGDTDDATKAGDFKNVEESWLVDLLIYTGVIIMGVNFDIDHFDVMFSVVTANTVTPEQIFQMWCRVRRLKSNEVLTFMNKNLIKFESIPWTYEEIINAVYVNRHKDMNVNTETVYDEESGTFIQQIVLGDYEKTMVYNKLRRFNTSENYIFQYFLRISLHHGYKTIINNPEDELIEDEYKSPQEEENEDGEIKKKKKISDKFKQIIEAKNITKEEYLEIIKLEKASLVNETQRHEKTKYYYCDRLGFLDDRSKLTLGLLTKYYEKIDEYRCNWSLLGGGITDVLPDGITNYQQKAAICNSILKDLEFDNHNDLETHHKRTHIKELINKNLIPNNVIYTSSTSSQFLFNLPNKKISTDFVIDDRGETNSIKRVLCYINKYLSQFGLMLKTSYINESKKKEYSIFHLEHDPFITKFTK